MTEIERRTRETEEFKRKVRALMPQDWYCKACVHFGGCNVLLNDGEECGDRMTEEQRDFSIASGDFNAPYDWSVKEIDYRMPDEND